jgi:hypothetical protein
MRTQLIQWRSPHDKRALLTLEVPAQGSAAKPVIGTPAYELSPADAAFLKAALEDCLRELAAIGISVPEFKQTL